MSTSTTPTVDKAIDFLNATVIAPKPLIGERYAYYADETGRYYIVTDTALNLLATYLDRAKRYIDPRDCGADERAERPWDWECENSDHEHDDEMRNELDAYSWWCSVTDEVEMPKWWTPDRQSAYRMRTYPCCGQLPHGLRSSCTYHLEHGEHEPVVDEILSPDESEEFDAPGQADGVDVYLVTADFSTGMERHPGR